MKGHEQILKGARMRWACNTDTESLINEVRSLLSEIETYRDCIVAQRKILDATVKVLQDKRR